MLKGKKILLGVSGSIAAYKSAALVRLLVKSGASVKVLMTHDAHEFVTPLTLATLSKNPVLTQFKSSESGEWNNHVELALWADYMLMAPATANTIAKMANGLCDNLLLATYLSARCEVFVAPAMDLDMYAHPATQHNLTQLKEHGVILLPVAEGELASGLTGKGRMIEPEEIVERLSQHTLSQSTLKGKKVLVTAGPTYENIDPVRFIGNHSSGKMGFAIAETFARMGAQVTLVTGPTELQTEHEGIKRIDVTSAQEMFDKTVQVFEKCHIAVMSAAVADYTPEKVAVSKIKKSGDELVLKLKKTKDILSYLGSRKKAKQLLVGFALETDHEEENAMKKLHAKNLDFIVLNSLKTKGAGFKHPTNQITILHRNGQKTAYPLKSKYEVAADIVNQLTSLMNG
ncbi:MAG: bifunctional phosphopantothenoylcysteine decarboxylase/phosphopantothenate--cysteine ligase CoaBC [Bacteroidia bacterium]|jgi:phosphopantothenoylcysteine decarboxylase/phosphopantothenate--cysteine ligase|nr:bifunctional phosphopantothenoylcysteine decarboxylase/phosphopantothenate--cysteine ligase CoaBC [Bacteroidia bacterium]